VRKDKRHKIRDMRESSPAHYVKVATFSQLVGTSVLVWRTAGYKRRAIFIGGLGEFCINGVTSLRACAAAEAMPPRDPHHPPPSSASVPSMGASIVARPERRAGII